MVLLSWFSRETHVNPLTRGPMVLLSGFSKETHVDPLMRGPMVLLSIFDKWDNCQSLIREDQWCYSLISRGDTCRSNAFNLQISPDRVWSASSIITFYSHAANSTIHNMITIHIFITISDQIKQSSLQASIDTRILNACWQMQNAIQPQLRRAVAG